MAGGPSQAMTTVITVQGLIEPGGGILLALGVLTQLVAIAFGIIMIGAIVLKLTRGTPVSSRRPPPDGSSIWSSSPPRCCFCSSGPGSSPFKTEEKLTSPAGCPHDWDYRLSS